MDEIWVAEQQRNPGAPSLGGAVFRLLRLQVVAGSVLAFCQGLLTTVARPLILRYIIQAVTDDDDVDLNDVVLLLVGLAAVVFIEGWLGVLYRHLLADNLGTSVRSVVLERPQSCFVNEVNRTQLGSKRVKAMLF